MLNNILCSYFQANDKKQNFLYFRTETTLVDKFDKRFLGIYFRGQNNKINFAETNTAYLSLFCPNAEKYGPEKLGIRTLFTEKQIFVDSPGKISGKNNFLKIFGNFISSIKFLSKNLLRLYVHASNGQEIFRSHELVRQDEIVFKQTILHHQITERVFLSVSINLKRICQQSTVEIMVKYNVAFLKGNTLLETIYSSIKGSKCQKKTLEQSVSEIYLQILGNACKISLVSFCVCISSNACVTP